MYVQRLVCALVLVVFVLIEVTAAGTRPNLVLVLADDLGAHDPGCYGADLLETPHLDGLAQPGLRLTQAYAPAPVCAPSRAGKGTRYEGGLRAPLRARWPRGTPAGRNCDEPVVLTDLLPTLLAAAGQAPDPDRALEGLNLMPFLAQPEPKLRGSVLNFHYPHHYFAPTALRRVETWRIQPANAGFLAAQKEPIWEPDTR